MIFFQISFYINESNLFYCYAHRYDCNEIDFHAATINATKSSVEKQIKTVLDRKRGILIVLVLKCMRITYSPGPNRQNMVLS